MLHGFNQGTRDERCFDETAFKEDFAAFPFTIIDTFPNTDEKLHILNTLITDCIQRHAPLTLHGLFQAGSTLGGGGAQSARGLLL